MAASVVCTHCGAKLTLKNPVAPGKKVNCPKCKKIFVVEADEEPAEEILDEEVADVAEEPPKRKKPPKSIEDADEEEDDEPAAPSKGKKSVKAKADPDEDDDEKPAKPKKAAPAKKSNALLLVGIAGVLLLCCGGTGGAGFYFRNKINIPRMLGFEKDAAAKTKDKDRGNDDKGADKGKTDGVIVKDKDAKQNPGTPEFVMTAEQFCEEFVKDREAAKKKYRFKIVELTGVAASVTIHRDTSKKNQLTMHMQGIPGKYGIIIQIEPSDWQVAYRLSSGQKVKIVGRFESAFDGISLLQFGSGKLSEVTKSEIREITSADLATEFEKSPAEADKKYRGTILVSGQLVEYKKNPIAGFAAKFKGSDKTSVEFFAGDIDSGEIERLKVGGTFVVRTTKCLHQPFRNAVYLENVMVTSLEPSKTVNQPQEK